MSGEPDALEGACPVRGGEAGKRTTAPCLCTPLPNRVKGQFYTLKYSLRWPSEGFESFDAARQRANEFMNWCNHEHKHSALKFVTPAQRHRGEDVDILA